MGLGYRRLTLMAAVIIFATVITLFIFRHWVNLQTLTIISMAFAIAILIDYLVENSILETSKLLLTGAVAGSFDFVIELLGTSTANWVYYNSNYFILGLVPLELPLLFFAGGVIARHIYIWSSKFEKPVNVNAVFYLLIIFGVFMYARAMYLLEIPISSLYIAAPIGLWGICNISKEGDRVSALALATLVAALDAIAETLVIHGGGYDYAAGFSWDIPIIYALLALGFFGLMEKIDMLDRFLEYPVIKSILKAFGIRRSAYAKKVKKAVRKVREKANHLIKK